MHPLPHLATRIFDTPLLIAPQKLEVILAALAPRLGIEMLPVSAAVATEKVARKPFEVTPDGIAIIPVEGTLVHKTRGLDALSGLRSYVDIQQEVEDAATDPAIKGILLEIDSPGGEVAGAFDVADAVYAARAAKPFYAVANNDAFSAAYLLASGAERIFVSRTSGVGSVGVIVSHLDMSASDERMGYRYTVVSAGARKADFNPHAPLSEEARSVLTAEVDRAYALLVSTVARNRGLAESAVRGSEAGLFFGGDALTVKFADCVGTRQDALASLRTAIGPMSVSIRTQGRTSMQDELLAAETQTSAADLDAIRAEARSQGYAEAREVVELCALAGLPASAGPLLAKEATPAEARQQLLETRAGAEQGEIRSHVMPDTGTGLKADPENSPVMKAVERLAGKGGK